MGFKNWLIVGMACAIGYLTLDRFWASEVESVKSSSSSDSESTATNLPLNSSEGLANSEVERSCEALVDLAEYIMDRHQAGQSERVMRLAADRAPSPGMRALVNTMVDDVSTYPRVDAASSQQLQIDLFSARWEQKCYLAAIESGR